MAIIKQLDTTVSNMIAAGEVVLGPHSVVKELVENSIDAKAKAIKIVLEEAGLKRIEVIDDGCGMDSLDANLAFSRHATSKITSAFDLGSIRTLGFRGEALPSIASVSNVELYTKRREDEYGIKVTLKAGKIVGNETCATNNGTRIVVANLFYNTPARLKYLKGPAICLAQISELIAKIALAHPEIAISLENNGNLLLNTSGTNNYEEIFNEIYGTQIAKMMNHQQFEFDGISLDLYFSNPVVNRSRKNDITVIVNGRFVRSPLINNAIILAYENYIPKYRYPVVLFKLDIDPLLIDINVHPQKTEIKFSLEETITKFTYDSVLNALRSIQVIKPAEHKEALYEPINFDNYLHEEVKEPVYIPVKNNHEQVKKHVEIKQEENIEEDIFAGLEEPSLEDETVQEEPKYNHLPYLEYIGQLSGTYLLFQNEEGLYLVDQHAAQERVNYEYYKNVLVNPNTDNIDLLVPYSIRLKTDEYIVLQANMDNLAKYGLYLEDMGNNTFFVRKTPLWIKDNYEEVIEKTLYYLIEKNVFDIGLLRDGLAKMVACKASIKANTFITSEGAYNLLKDLDKCQNPYNCPHGRPVFVKLTLKEIEKLFLRTL